MCNGSDVDSASVLEDLRSLRALRHKSPLIPLQNPFPFPRQEFKTVAVNLSTPSAARGEGKELNVSPHALMQFYNSDGGFYDAKINDDDIWSHQ